MAKQMKTLGSIVMASALALNALGASNNYMSDHAAGAKQRIERTAVQDNKAGTITVVRDGVLVRKEGYADFNKDGRPDYFTVKFNYGALLPSDANYVITTYIQNTNGVQVYSGVTTYPGDTRNITFKAPSPAAPVNLRVSNPEAEKAETATKAKRYEDALNCIRIIVQHDNK